MKEIKQALQNIDKDKYFLDILKINTTIYINTIEFTKQQINNYINTLNFSNINKNCIK